MYNQKDASYIIDKEFNSINFENSKIHVVFGYNRSDIGKAELVARLGILLENDFSILKFDGFLNTNSDGRYPSRTGHDFVIYKKYHDHIEYGGYNLILNGPFIIEFLNRFGESKEHLMFRPHVAKFFARRIFENWINLGKPKDLIIEIGGTILDDAVIAYVIPGIKLLKEFHQNIRLFLLTDASYNRIHIKAKPVLNALELGQRQGLIFNIIFVRLPSDYPISFDLKETCQYIEQKIADSVIYNGKFNKVICIPYYSDAGLIGYTEYLINFNHDIFPR